MIFFTPSLADEKQTAYQHNGKARANGTKGTFSGQELAALRQKQQGHCAYCGESNVLLTVDHIVPTTRGGTNFISNICLACSKCNVSKGAKLVYEWVDRWYLPWHGSIKIPTQRTKPTGKITSAVDWGHEHERLAEEVVKKYARCMGEMGIANRSGKKINRSGAVLIALMLAAGEVDV